MVPEKWTGMERSTGNCFGLPTELRGIQLALSGAANPEEVITYICLGRMGGAGPFGLGLLLLEQLTECQLRVESAVDHVLKELFFN